MLHSNPAVDIAVLKMNSNLLKKNFFLFYSQIKQLEPVFFAGFPYGLRISIPSYRFPIPFVKKAVISAFLPIDQNIKGYGLIILDGINNPGFSGSPVFRNDGGRFSLISVVSGYFYDNKEVNSPDALEKLYGKLTFDQNSGLIKTYSADLIKEIIKMNK